MSNRKPPASGSVQSKLSFGVKNTAPAQNTNSSNKYWSNSSSNKLNNVKSGLNKPFNPPSSLRAGPQPGNTLSASDVNSRTSSTYQSSGAPSNNTVRRVPSSSLGKRAANSEYALRQAFGSSDSFSEDVKPVDDSRAPPTIKESLKKAVSWQEDDFEFDDLDELETSVVTTKLAYASAPAQKPPVSSASAWKNQFVVTPPSSDDKKPAVNVPTVKPHSEEPAPKKPRTLPWKEKEKAEAVAAEQAAQEASLKALLETPQRALPWNKTASAVKAAKIDLKGKIQQKRALSTASLGGNPQETTGKRGSKPTKHFMSSEQSHVLDMVVNEGKSVFFTGSAGTGKSVLLREIITGLRKKYNRNWDSVAVTASTGLAACNIGGVTLHSFSGIGLGKENVEGLVKKIRRVAKSKQRWLRTKVLIIDEISMVDGDLFDKLEGIARTLKNNGRPFGGIQIVVTGDFFQLPPVPEGNKMAKFAFEANTWGNCVDHTILLTNIFRQKDPVFAGMLNEMRLGQLSPTSIANFRKLARPINWDDGLQATELFPTRREVDIANGRQLQNLKGIGEVYTAHDESAVLDQQARDKLLSNCMAPPTLELRLGAQVMLVKNMDETLVNGSLGRVVAFMSEKTYALAQEDGDDFLFGSQEALQYDEMSNKQKVLHERFVNEQKQTSVAIKKYPLVQWSVADGTQRRTLMLPESWKFELPTGEVQASRKQVPLILAWAISIHKAQGQTLDRVKVDLGKVFEKGQAYVALSRATTQEGLQVLNFDPRKVMAHDKVRNFYTSLTTAEAAKLQHGGVSAARTIANNAVAAASRANDGIPDDDELDELFG